jgi:hypothetical protein
MDPKRIGLFVILLPALACGLTLLALWRRDTLRGRAAGALAVGLGFLVGHVGWYGGLPRLPPHDSSQALFYVALVALAGGLVDAAVARPWVRLPVRLACGAGAVWLVLRNLVARMETGQAWTTVGGLGLAIAAVWSAVDPWARRRPGASGAAVLYVVATSAAAAIALSGSALVGQFGGVAAACLGAALVFAWMRPQHSLAGGGVGAVTVLVGVLLVSGVFLSELSSAVAWTIGAAPLLVWVSERVPVKPERPARAVLARVALVAVPLAAALVPVIRAFLSKPEDPYGY